MHNTFTSIQIYLSALLFTVGALAFAQCPNTGETKVIKPKIESGYYFYKLIGSNSFEYYLDGNKFSYDENKIPGRTLTFIDDITYEVTVVNKQIFKKYLKGKTERDILIAQAKFEQDYFASVEPDLAITDFGAAASPVNNGTHSRLFYLWKKEKASQRGLSRQYLCSTRINDLIIVLSVMPSVAIPEASVLTQLEKYTGRFKALSTDEYNRLNLN